MDSTDYEKRGRPRRKNDELLKGIFEENFTDFLRFIYSNADAIFDFDRGINLRSTILWSLRN